MTRFARAKGSKASNERLPNEATPWHLMKQQLEESKSNAPLKKKKSAKELLKDQEDTVNNSTNKNTQEWAEFEDNKSRTKAKKAKNNSKSNKNLVKNSENKVASEGDDNVEKSQAAGDVKATDRRTKFSSKKKQAISNPNSINNEKESNTPQEHSNHVALSKRQKRNQKRKLEMSNNGPKRFKKDASGNSSSTLTREERIKKKGEYKRRKPDASVTKIVINGVETEIVMYDGFPVKKEDAERLAELKQKMIMKGKSTFVYYIYIY